jgi:F420-non-reducing hydrogenase iron-sulfur subunit
MAATPLAEKAETDFANCVFLQERNLPDTNNAFEPDILAFCCRHCAYAAADLAGVMRLSYPPNIRIVELPCSGKLDIVQVLHAFERGVDGVMVAG